MTSVTSQLTLAIKYCLVEFKLGALWHKKRKRVMIAESCSFSLSAGLGDHDLAITSKSPDIIYSISAIFNVAPRFARKESER